MDTNAIEEKLKKAYPLVHRWHNRFHLEMPFGLMNDPNGLCFYQGEYHIFFQWNPLGCMHKNKCWGHTKTRDFLQYQRPRLALYPVDVKDKDGCYTGSAFLEQHKLKVMYTANARDASGKRQSCQRVAVWSPTTGDLKREQIAIPAPPEGYTEHFRDPAVFEHKGQHLVLVGGQTKAERGCLLLYREEAEKWFFCGELRTQLGNFGFMWECPTLLDFGRQDVLLFSPQGVPHQPLAYQNRYASGYVVGHFSLGMREMVHGAFQELDRGFDFYAPQAFTHEGRHILLGWMGMPEEEAFYPTGDLGWLYALTLPRILTLRHGKIYSEPLPELTGLRIATTAQEIEEEASCGFTRPLPEGAEILLDLRLGQANLLSFTLHYGLEKVVFLYDRQEQVMTIDRSGMHLGARGMRRFPLQVEELLSLQFFIDKTAVEVFFQHGEETASFLVFPEKNILPEFSLSADGELTAIIGKIWELDAIRYHE